MNDRISPEQQLIAGLEDAITTAFANGIDAGTIRAEFDGLMAALPVPG